MTTILRSDLFRNFMGGFVLGAAALFALQPDDALAHNPAQAAAAAIESESKATP